MGTWLGKVNDPRYTPSTTFETFPFPDGLTLNPAATDYAGDPRAQRIAEAASKLDESSLYNQRPAWLANAHREPDATVAAANGWPEAIGDDDALARLFELNQAGSAR